MQIADHEDILLTPVCIICSMHAMLMLLDRAGQARVGGSERDGVSGGRHSPADGRRAGNSRSIKAHCSCMLHWHPLAGIPHHPHHLHCMHPGLDCLHVKTCMPQLWVHNPMRELAAMSVLVLAMHCWSYLRQVAKSLRHA